MYMFHTTTKVERYPGVNFTDSRQVVLPLVSVDSDGNIAFENVWFQGVFGILKMCVSCTIHQIVIGKYDIPLVYSRL